MENGVLYFPCFVHIRVLYACLAEGQVHQVLQSGNSVLTAAAGMPRHLPGRKNIPDITLIASKIFPVRQSDGHISPS